jgi:hypothetical protein
MFRKLKIILSIITLCHVVFIPFCFLTIIENKNTFTVTVGCICLLLNLFFIGKNINTLSSRKDRL